MIAVIGICLSGGTPAQAQFALLPDTRLADIQSVGPARLGPEEALATYHRRMYEQATSLSAYSDTTVMKAELPETAQQAEYELQRQYAAPATLRFTPVNFKGDRFVKSNVLVRLLQSEVDHVSKRQGTQTAINDQNYKFSLKGTEDLNGVNCYVFQVKPRKKRVGLFKGRVYIDSYTGTMRRAEGTMVKSPSWWIKKIEFVQDFDEFGGFVFPTRMHSVNRVRLLGRTIVDVLHRNYRATAAAGSTIFGGGDGSQN